jgi:hypothetical protein
MEKTLKYWTWQPGLKLPTILRTVIFTHRKLPVCVELEFNTRSGAMKAMASSNAGLVVFTQGSPADVMKRVQERGLGAPDADELLSEWLDLTMEIRLAKRLKYWSWKSLQRLDKSLCSITLIHRNSNLFVDLDYDPASGSQTARAYSPEGGYEIDEGNPIDVMKQCRYTVGLDLADAAELLAEWLTLLLPIDITTDPEEGMQ